MPDLTLTETFTAPLDVEALAAFLHKAAEHRLTKIRFNTFAGNQREPSTLTLTAREH